MGHDRDRGAVRAFRADRIEGDVEVGAENAFTVPADFRAEDHIEDRGWLMGDAEPVTVRLAIDPRHLDGARGALGADAIITDETTVSGDRIVELTVTNRAALRSFVLGFLEHAEVLEPADVRADVVEWLQAVAAAPA